MEAWDLVRVRARSGSAAVTLDGQLAAGKAEFLDLPVELCSVSDTFVPASVQVADVRVDDVRPLAALGHDIVGRRGVDQFADGGLVQPEFPADRRLRHPLFPQLVGGGIHWVGEPWGALMGLTPRLAADPATAKGAVDFASQLAAALDVEGLVDRLGDHVKLRPFGKRARKSVTDLLGTPPSVKPFLNELPQFTMLFDLCDFGPRAASLGACLGCVRSVDAAVGMLVAACLAADRGRAPPQLGGNRPDRRLLAYPVGDMDALLHAQITR
jgi:hypothetical protein